MIYYIEQGIIRRKEWHSFITDTAQWEQEKA